MENKNPVDGLIMCPHCSSPYCYEQHLDSLIRWQCITCGFTSNSSMMKGTDLVRAFEEPQPRLILDIKFIDEHGFCWYPTVIDKINEGKYIIFPDGSSKEDWKWALGAAVPVTFDERDKFKKVDGTVAQYKTNSKFLHFDRLKFFDVLEAANFI